MGDGVGMGVVNSVVVGCTVVDVGVGVVNSVVVGVGPGAVGNVVVVVSVRHDPS